MFYKKIKKLWDYYFEIYKITFKFEKTQKNIPVHNIILFI